MDQNNNNSQVWDTSVFYDDPEAQVQANAPSRRAFLQRAAAVGATLAAAPLLEGDEVAAAQTVPPMNAPPATTNTSVATPSPVMDVTLRVNGKEQKLAIEPRVTLLDALRERLGLTGSKVGCNHGQCGACTVLIDGRRANACLLFAVMQEGKEITTIEGLANGDDLHPVQAAFIKHDGFQCGYCTPGQICSAVAMLGEVARGAPSAVTPNVNTSVALAGLSNAEIRERMSGNLCRCGAYVGIVAAIREVAAGPALTPTPLPILGEGQDKQGR